MAQALFIFQLIFFLFLFLFLFTIPGVSFLQKALKLSFWEQLIFGTILGWVIFTLIGYILLVLNLKLLITAAYLPIIFISLKKLKLFRDRITLPAKKFLIVFIPTFIAGVILQLLIISPSGLKIDGEILFWSSHAHDASWHIALMSQMEKRWPIQNPAFAGERLVNYHFFSDITPMYFHYLFKLSFLDLYFRFLPFFYAVSFGSLAYLLGKKVTGSFWGGYWSLIFADFAGSFGFIVTFLKNRTIGGESIFWSSQPQSTIGNHPQIAALILFLSFFYLFNIYLKNKSRNIFIALSLIGGVLITFKVYAGVALLGGLAVCAIWQVVKERKIDFVLLFLICSMISLMLFLPNTAKSPSLLVFEPWWYIRTLMVAPDRLDKVEWELRRQTYLSEGNFKRVIQIELQTFLIFLFGNLGMRFLGLAILPKYVKTFFNNYLNQFILTIILISFVFPMIFIQKGDTTGTSQFFQYDLLFFGFLAAEAMLLFAQKIKSLAIKVIFGAVIVTLAIPTQIGLLANFYQRSAFAKIDASEQQALSFLNKNTSQDAIVLTPLYNKYFVSRDITPPIWAWSDSDYVAAFGERAVYFADQEQIANTGYNYQSREELENELFATKNPQLFNILIKKTNASYLYFPLPQKPKVDLNQTFLRLIFSNGSVEIWKI